MRVDAVVAVLGLERDQPLTGGLADGTEPLDRDPGAGDGQVDRLRRGVGGLGHSVAGHAELVVRQASQCARQADRGAAVAELVDEDRRIPLGQAHVEAEHVLAGHLVGEGAREGAQDLLLVRGVRVAEDAGLRATVEEVDGRPLPGHGAGQPGHLPHGQRRARPGPALAHAARGVVDRGTRARSPETRILGVLPKQSLGSGHLSATDETRA